MYEIKSFSKLFQHVRIFIPTFPILSLTIFAPNRYTFSSVFYQASNDCTLKSGCDTPAVYTLHLPHTHSLLSLSLSGCIQTAVECSSKTHSSFYRRHMSTKSSPLYCVQYFPFTVYKQEAVPQCTEDPRYLNHAG